MFYRTVGGNFGEIGMSTQLNNQMIRALIDARVNSIPVSTLSFTDIDFDSGYELQHKLIATYIDQYEKKHTGWKVALSGAAAQAKYELVHPVYGQLLSDMQFNAQDKFVVSANESLKLEVELAFRLKTALNANIEYSDAALIAAIGEVIPALEIVNVRWENWNFNIGQFLADNSAAYGYVLGSPISLNLQDLLQDIQIEQSSHELVLTYSEQDNALKNYLWLIRTLLAKNISLSSGEIILTGSLIRPLNIDSGWYEVKLFGQTLAIQVEPSL